MIHGFLLKHGSSLLKYALFFSFSLSIQLAAAQTVDCSNSANCSDPYCQFAANIERGCNCFDNVDNDGDGKIDKADPNCATYYGLIFVGEGSDCSIVPPGSSDPFDLVDVPIMTAQNTADTQSKIAVGDVDGDGIPDAIITSKWNRELRVVATNGSEAGDIMADFKTTGAGASIFSGTGDCAPNKLLFEHEVLIADIDGNGTGEIFGIVSNRGGNPSTPPTCFFMVGFTYTAGTLTPLWNAVAIGPDRTGIFGIADMDGDGKAEIYMRDRIYAAETGKLLATGGGNWDLDVVAGPVAVNISGDNRMELVCGTKIYGIPDLSNRNPASPAALTLLHDMNALGPNDCYVKLMIDPIEYGQDTHSSCSVADIDKDGNMDVVITGALNSTSGPTTVFYWNVAQSRVTYFSPPDPAYANGWPWGTSRVNIGDANGDGDLDLSFIAGNRLWCLKTDQTTGALSSLWASFRTINDSRSGIVAVTIYDFNNDGDPEMVYRDSQELAVIDGATGTTKIWSSPCQSHTYTEGPIVADVNGDGATDICVTCATAKFDILDPIQQQALGQFRLYYSSGNEWLPTRKVWNQPGYFVVNINDDLTLPFPQLDQNLIFGTADCPNGTPGPQMPMNVFLNQVPFLSANGCPVFPAPDLSFDGDNPDNPGVDSDGDGVYSAAVEVVPPICGDLGISVRFNIINDGDLPITANVPVSFFIGDPTDPGITSDSLIHSAVLPINDLQVDSTYTSPFIMFNGTGAAFRLYIVLNNDGSVLPIQTSGSSPIECRIDNNIYSAFIQPDPFTTKIEKIADNFKCDNTAPDNGELRVRIFKAGVEVTDYSQYGFQWYTGTAASYSPIAGATNYNITGLAEGDYTAIVTNLAKGCVGVPVDTTIVRQGNDPEVIINVISHQTVCSPPNGELQAQITGGNTGFTFEWFDIALNPLGISGPTANNLVAGNYLVRVSKDGCTKNSLPQTVDGPVVPDAQAATLQNVEDCLNPNSGSITATALFNGAPQDPANYSFEWYFYDNATFTRGSILPGANGTGPTRTGLSVGHYQVVITDLATQCAAVQSPITEITSQTIIPTAVITELTPQTSCDPANPNGRLGAAVDIGGVVQDPSSFTFEWFKGDNTLPANAHTNVSGVNGSVAETVSGGGVFYTVRVTTGNNCSDTEKLIITEDLNLPIVTLATTDNGICDPALAASTYNGTVTASVTFDGVAVADFTNYEITWHNGALGTDPVIAGETSTLLDERNGGFYTIVVERTDLSCVSVPVNAQVLNTVTLPTIATDSIPSTNCAGGAANGGVIVTSVLPADTYSYRWFDPSSTLIAGATTASISGRQGGAGQNYTVEVTLGSTGCRSTLATNIPDNKLTPVLTLTPSDNSICDGALGFNGSIASSFTDTNAQAGHTYTYLWSTGSDMTNLIGGQTASTLTQRNGGFYTATIRNVTLNCTSSPVTTQILNNQILPAITAVPTPSTNCPGGADNGAITASVTNGLAGQTFAFQWSKGNLVSDPDVPAGNGGNTATITGQQGNQNYIVLVRNNQTGCENTLIQAIADNSVVPVLTLLTTDNSICDPALGYNGTVSRDVITDVNANGTDTYSFVWSAGNNMSSPIAVADDSNPTLSGRNGGFYTVTVTNDRLSCTSNPVTAEVNNNQILPAISAVPTPSTNCPGGADNGGITVSITNALAGQTFGFEWHKGNLMTDPAVPLAKGGNTATIFDQQGSQNYIVQARNNQTGCINTLIQTIADNSIVPVLSLIATDNSICDAALGYNGTVTGSIDSDVNANGTDTYTFVWSSGNDMTSPIMVADPADPVLTGRNGGFYTATIENDRLGCVSSPITIEVNNNQILPAISATPTPSTNCPGGADNGAVTVAITNGLAGQTFSFEWHKGNLMTDPAVPVLNGGNTATIFDQQGSQNYIVQARNNQTGCLNTLIQTIADNSIVPVLALVSTENSICDVALGYNGTVTGSVTSDANANGTDTYTFVWSSGNDMTSPIMVADPADPVLTGRNGGFYTATIENDRLGCVSSPITIEVNNNQILPVISATPTPSTNCPGGADNGQITVSITNGLAGQTFSFEWHKGNLMTDPAVPAAQGGNAATIFDQQGNQNYIVQARNNQTGCLNTLIQTIADNSVVPVLTLFTTDNSICDPGLGYNGTVSRDAIADANAQGTDTYTFIWSTGNDMSSPIGVADPADPVLTGRNGGFYTVTVENDRLGCVSNPVTAQVMNNQVLPAITAVPTPSTNCPTGAANGEIDVTITNGLAGQTFSFDWFQGTLISDPIVPPANGGQSEDVINIQGGLNYLVLATNDQTGCANTFIQLLADDSEVPVLTLVASDNSICDPGLGFNGSITQNSMTDPNASGIDTYTFAWSTGNDMTAIILGETAATLAGRNGGFYTATVTNDRLKCTSNPVTIEILNNQILPAISATPDPSTNCLPMGAPNGEITVTVTNGLAGQTFSYEWHKGNLMTDPAVALADGGDSDHIINQQGGSNYIVEVTIDQTGCTNTFVQPLQDISALPVLTLTPSPNTICVPNPDYDGSIATAVVDANFEAGHTYSYVWSLGTDMSSPIVGQTASSISLLQGGFYTATITNTTLGCTSSPVVAEVVDNLILPAISLAPTPSTNCVGGDPNGEITASVTNGLAGQTFSFLWFRGTTTADPAVLPAEGGNTPTIFDQQGGQNFAVEATIVQTGCTNTQTILLQDDSEVPVISPLGHTDNENCTAPFNGTAFVNAATPFTYRGNTISAPYTGFNLVWSAGTVLPAGDQTTVLAAGTYTLQVTVGAANTITTNNDNCVSAPVSVVILDDLTMPVVDVAITDQTSCDPALPNGQLQATETSGVGAYSFDWYLGVGAVGAPLGEIIDGQTTADLASDDYTVVVQNTATRCESTVTTFLPDNITLPGLTLVESQAVTNCTAANGAITATPVITSLADGDFTIYYLDQNTSNPVTIKTDPGSFSSTLVADLVYGSLAPGYYAALVRDEITHCESNGVIVQVTDATVAATITIDNIVAATFCATNEGNIDISIAGGTGPYIVNWYDGGPINAGPYNFINSANEPAFAGAPHVPASLPPPPLVAGEDLWELGVGIYTVVVEDALGCGTLLSNDVPFQNAPVITLTATNSTQCDVLNGDGELQLDVDVTGVLGPTTYSYLLKQGLDPGTAVYLAGENCTNLVDDDGDGDIDGLDNDCQISFAGVPDHNQTYSALNPGGYVIEVIDHTAGCSVFRNATIETDALAPVVTLGTITPNTTCPGQIANFADGSVEITIDKDPLDATVFAPVYQITSITAATATPATNAALYPLNVAQGVATVLFTDTGVPPLDFDGGFSAQTYTIDVVETTSGCTTQQFVSIPDQPAIPQLLEVDITNDSFCAPLTNGSAEVVNVNPLAVADYDYTWYTDAALTAVFYSAPGTGAGGGELLNAAKNAAWLGAAGFGMGTREYYVRGIRRPGTGFGAGCPTPAIKVVVQDEHVAPVPVLTALPNTSCDPLVGEGSISIATTTASPDPLVLNATYQYDLTLGGAPQGTVAGQAGALSTPFTALLHNAAPYSVLAMNEENGCVASSDITINQVALPLQITNHTFNDQLICLPNGDITVTEIQIDRAPIGQGLQTFSAALTGDFDFQWFRANPATPGTFNPATPLQDSGPANIDREVLEPGAGAGQYPTMGAGTYYVVATRFAGATVPVVGRGCATPPLRIDIQDKHINPVVTLLPFSNTSCSVVVFEGEIEVDVTDASPAGFGPFDYDYAWPTVTSGTTPGPLANPYTGVSATDGPFTGLEEGDYTIEVTNNQTGCQMIATTTILKNTTPIFVTQTEIVPQFYCSPSGRIEVTQINYEDRNGAPQIAPLGDFDFSWTRVGLGAVGTTLPVLDSTAANYPAIGADMYQVFATRTAGSPGLDCVSAPVNLQIADESVDPVLTLTPFSNTSCTAAFEGEIEIDITDASVPKVPPVGFVYDYTWTDVNAAGLILPPNDVGQSGASDLYTGLEDGVYRLNVLNTVTGCTTQATTTIIKNQTPVFVQDVTMVPQFYCDPSGNLNVVEVRFNDRDGVTQNGPLVDFTYTWSKNIIANVIATTDPGAALPGHTGTELDSIVYNAIGADAYWVVATRQNGTPGAGCSSAPFKIDITDERVDPVITLTPFSNTSCTIAFEGQIEVDISDGSAAKVPPAAFNYDYTWAAVNPLGLALPPNQAGQNGVNNLYSGLQDGTYQLTAVNTVTGCDAVATTTIIKNQTPVFLTVVNPTPQFYCDPSGRLEVTQVNYNDRNGNTINGLISDFTFTWDRGAVGTNVATTIGSDPRGAFLDSLVYAGIGFDPNYYVVATRTNGSPGAGCSSAPIKVEIVDGREYPSIVLTPFSNTSCTMAFEGQIEIDITDNSAAKVPPSLDAGLPILYDYTWADVNAAGLALPPNDAGQTGLNNLYQNLEDGTYRLTAVNTITGCSSQATTNIIKNQTPVFLTVVNPTPQFYCDPSGRLEVTQVNYNDRNGNTINGLISDFTFTWDRGAVGTNVATTIGSNPRGAFLDSLVYAGIGFDPNYYVVATRTNGSPGAGCSSAPIKVEIVDGREYPNIVLTPFSNTSCTIAFEGQIEIDITDNSAAKVPPSLDAGLPILYDYTWADVNAAGLALPPNDAGQTGLSNLYQNLQDGTYRLTAVNTITGCSSQATTNIIKNQTPVFLTVVNPTPQFYCDPSGKLEVTGVSYTDRTGANIAGNLADFTFDWARGTIANAVAQTIGSNPRGAFLDSLVYAGIGFDPNYYVVATRTTGSPGAGCSSAPIKVEITDMREYPAIVLTPFSNTSCTAAFEGEIEVNISDASAAKVMPSPDAGQPILYDYTWTDVNTVGLTLPPNAAGQNGSANLYQNLQDGVYRLTAVNTITGCSSDATTTIIRNQTPIFVQDVDVIPQLYCTPSGNIEVTSITYNDRTGASVPGPLTDFMFTWTRNDLVTAAGITDGSLPGGTVLDSTSYAGPGTIGTGTYFVVATRNTGTPGAGCQSAPFRVEIGDERENPVIAFNTLANTACDNNFDGRITVLSTTSNAPGAGSNYDIQWLSVPVGNTLTDVTDVTSSYTTPLTDVIGPGSFTVRVTNRSTSCFSDAVVDMISNPQPVEILAVNSMDQMICFPDGSITVSAVSPAVVAEYDFNWFRNSTGSPALVDGASATITSATLNNANYPAMGADTYFVVGEKTSAGGSGCLTPPFRVDVQDLHVDPTATLTFTPNSSCDPSNPNGQLVAVASERDGTTDLYSFVWTLNNAALPPVTTQVDASPNSQLNNAFEGDYMLVVTNTNTGCDVTSGLEVNLDQTLSLPNIITVTPFHPTDCLGSGWARVDEIRIGSGPPITGAALGTDFTYEWYQNNFVPADLLADTDPQLDNINSGRYFVRVQNLTTDCQSDPTEVVVLEDNIVYPLVTITQTALQVSCITTTGSAGLEARGDGQTDANPNYLFQWFNNLDTTPPAIGATSQINNLLDGEYSVVVTNTATGCSAEELYIIRDDSERFMPELSVNTQARVNCLVPDGVLLAREVGYDPNSGYPYPVPNYTAEFYPGANADVSQPGTVMTFVPGFNRNWRDLVDVGAFTVKLTDNNTGCFVVGSDIVLDERTNPVVVIDIDNPLINCDPARPNGQLSATADDGRVGGYQFDWYNGVTASGAVVSDNNKLIGIGMGDYTVRVTNDITGCFADATGGVTDGRLTPPTPTALLVFDRTRCDYPDGWVSANVGGITFNYSFDWYDGVALKPVPDFNGVNYKDRDIGMYTVTAMDEITGCISEPASVEVKDMRVIPEVIIHTTPSYCEELPGQVGGTGSAEIELAPANVSTDDVTWTLEGDATILGIGSYMTSILPGFYQANVITSQGCPATGVGEVKTEVFSYNLVSNNGDQRNDNFRIDCISQFPNNNVKIFNRAGVLVYEADGYDNNDVVFKGLGEKGLYTIGNELPVGTYFYVIDKRDGSKPKTGYLELVR